MNAMKKNNILVECSSAFRINKVLSGYEEWVKTGSCITLGFFFANKASADWRRDACEQQVQLSPIPHPLLCLK